MIDKLSAAIHLPFPITEEHVRFIPSIPKAASTEESAAALPGAETAAPPKAVGSKPGYEWRSNERILKEVGDHAAEIIVRTQAGEEVTCVVPVRVFSSTTSSDKPV